MTDQIKKQLTTRLIELQKRIAAIHKDFAKGRDADWAEQAGERENDEVLNALESEAKVEIQQLSNAITRIESGNYGTCEQCGENISKARLEVRPEALRCINCAE